MRLKTGVIFFLYILTILAMVKSEPLNTGNNDENRNLPSLACHYETTVESLGQLHQTRDWYLWREPSRIETQEKIYETGEIWRLGRDGSIFYYRVFHRYMRVIEYTTGDLRALNGYQDWNKLTHILEPNLLAKLKLAGTTKILGRNAQRYQGEINGIDFEVWWLKDEQIPALVRQGYSGRVVILKLKELYPINKSPWRREDTANYKRMDYADIGDRHSDPFLKKLLQDYRHSH
jgi:hypothetical protein